MVVSTLFASFDEFSPTQAKVAVALGAAGLALATKVAVSQRTKARNPRGLPLPPGPKPLPIIGNLLQFPQEKPWEVYREWSKTLGDVILLRVPGQNVLILNTHDAITGLLETNTVNTSDRPSQPTSELIGLTFSAGVMQYGPEWKANRKAFHQILNPTQIPGYRNIIEEETIPALKKLLEDPDNLFPWIRDLFNVVVMRAAYGFRDFSYNAHLIAEAEEFMHRVAEVSIPGAYMVNSLPWMQHLPRWLPGMGWRQRLDDGAKLARSMVERPFGDIKHKMKNGSGDTDQNSVAARLIQDLPAEDDPTYEFHETVAKHVSATAFTAGGDTTIASGQAFFLAMAMYPDVQRKAQSEIDSITKGDRLPTLSDKVDMPYVQALLKELSRWHTVGPLGVPHQTSKDDEYKGYFIPDKTIIFTNAWGVAHDPTLYPDPFEFKPDRFLRTTTTATGEEKLELTFDNAIDPHTIVFGFGRRICPGRHFSNEALSYMVMTVLSAFDIKPSPKSTKPLELRAKTGLVSQLEPFEVSITPRSEKHARLILGKSGS